MKKTILNQMKNEINVDDYNHNKICITFVGGPGFGKSTISKMLCEKMNLFHCSNDYIARQIEKMDYDITDYEKRTELVSSIAFPFQDFLFENSIDFVLDANLMLYIDVIKKRCNSYNYKLFIIELEINHDEALRRSLKRLELKDKENLSDSDEADFKLFLRQYKDYKIIENLENIFANIDMERNDIEDQVDDIIKRINQLINN